MSNFSVGSEPARLCSGIALIQNLGTDEIYLDLGTSDVSGVLTPPSVLTAESGLKVASGQCVTILSESAEVYAISAGTSDVRVLPGATALSAVTA